LELLLFHFGSHIPEPIISSTILAPFIKYYIEELGAYVLKPLIEAGIPEIDTSKLACFGVKANMFSHSFVYSSGLAFSLFDQIPQVPHVPGHNQCSQGYLTFI
jgi:hypothetical protein